MELWPQISRQRIRHIIESYGLFDLADESAARPSEDSQLAVPEPKPSEPKPSKVKTSPRGKTRVPERSANDSSQPGLSCEALDRLMQRYSAAAVELALVQNLVETWGEMPPPRGSAFLQQVRDRLQTWEETTVEVQITPSQFFQITGLDPEPVFGELSSLVS